MRTLFDYAKKIDGDIIITMDSDGQFLPEEIPKLVNSLKENDADIITGYRFSDEKDMPSYRKFGNSVALEHIQKKRLILSISILMVMELTLKF
jgi:glycosyltransferase involved in cell wall biosynthesis